MSQTLAQSLASASSLRKDKEIRALKKQVDCDHAGPTDKALEVNPPMPKRKTPRQKFAAYALTKGQGSEKHVVEKAPAGTVSFITSFDISRCPFA